MTMMSSKRC